MKLYRTRLMSTLWRTPKRTHYHTSLAAAKKAVKKTDNTYVVVASCQVPDRLTQDQWCQLLEADAPGDQPLELTPVDLVTDYEEVWRSK